MQESVRGVRQLMGAINDSKNDQDAQYQIKLKINECIKTFHDSLEQMGVQLKAEASEI